MCMWRLALRETPGRHVLVVGAPGVLVAEIADLLREREAERREPLDQPREVLLVQRLQIAGLRLFGGGIRLVVGVVGAGDALAPTPRGAVAP